MLSIPETCPSLIYIDCGIYDREIRFYVAPRYIFRTEQQISYWIANIPWILKQLRYAKLIWHANNKTLFSLLNIIVAFG